MNVVESRDLLHYGFHTTNSYEIAFKMLKSFKNEEFKSLGPPQGTNGEPPVFACRFCRIDNYEHFLALANEDGKIGIQNTDPNSDLPQNNVVCLEGHMNAIFDLAWSDCSLRLVSVSGDHTAILWDVNTVSLFPIGMFEGHNRSVKVAAFQPNNNSVFATGARDGMVIIWDYRCKQPNVTTIKPDNMIVNAHCQSGGSVIKKNKKIQPSRAESITGLVFQDETHMISCSAGDGLIKVWDIRKCYTICQKKPPQPCASLSHPGNSAKNGFTSLSIDPGGLRLYANCMDNNIYCYNISNYDKDPVTTYTGYQNQTFYVKSCLSPDGKYILSGSSDEKAYIWDVKKPGPPLVQLVGHSAEVTSVDWANSRNESIKLVTCGDDSCYRLWRLSPPTDSDQSADPEVVGWAEWVDRSATNHPSITTPRSVKRLARLQYFTPTYSDSKRLKTEEKCSLERTVLSEVQSKTENKGARRLFENDPSQCSGVEILSPTSNLPNYVMEGTSPFHRCPMSGSKQKENWLAKLHTTPSPKIVKRLTPRRKSQTTPKACGNLLKFFRVAGKHSPINNAVCDVQKNSVPDEAQSVVP